MFLVPKRKQYEYDAMYSNDIPGQVEALVAKSAKFLDLQHEPLNKYVFLDVWNTTNFRDVIAVKGTVRNVVFERILCKITRIREVNVKLGFFEPLGGNNIASVKLSVDYFGGGRLHHILIMPDMLIRTSDPYLFWDNIPYEYYRGVIWESLWGKKWLKSIDADKSPAGTYWLLAPAPLHIGKDSNVHQHTPPQKTISFQKMMEYAHPISTPDVTPTVLVFKVKDVQNPYALFEEINAGQQVEKTTLASYLGSCAHWYASFKKKPVQTKAEKLYLKEIPGICKLMGDKLLQETGTIIYNERDVYWPCMIDKQYVHSRVDMVTQDTTNEIHVWEFKTRWGNWNKKCANMDYTQAVVYAHMLRKANVLVKKVHIRYVTYEKLETPEGSGRNRKTGQIKLYTFTYRVTARTITDLMWRS